MNDDGTMNDAGTSSKKKEVVVSFVTSCILVAICFFNKKHTNPVESYFAHTEYVTTCASLATLSPKRMGHTPFSV